ncbi:MAG: type II toxin-antitoxin system HicB family antitoxin [Candidatus Micrarchaeia archaeon]
MKVKILLDKDEDGVWVATVPSLPGVVSQGKTRHEAELSVKEAIELHLETMLQEGLELHKAKAPNVEFLEVSLS